jgi:hypothetical protein
MPSGVNYGLKQLQNSKSLEIIHNAVKERYDFELERIRRLDDKANNVLTIAGVLATLVTGFGSLSITLTQFNISEIIAFVAFVACLGLLIASFCFGLRAYQIRSYNIVPDPPVLIVEGEKMNADKIFQALGDTYALAIEENMKKNEGKVYNIKVASWLVFVSLILFSIFAFLTMVSK